MQYRRTSLSARQNLPPGAQVDWAHPISRGLTGCWPLNEGGGARIANYGNRVNTTIKSSVTAVAPKWNSGKLGHCLRFPSGSYIIADTVPTPGNYEVMVGEKWAVSVWMRTTDVSGTAAICGKYHDTNTVGWALTCEWGNPTFGIQQDGAKYSYKYADRNIADGHWHHVLGVCDGTTTLAGLTLYIDGKKDAAGSSFSAGTITDYRIGTRNLVIGSRDSTAPNPHVFLGDLALVQFWKGRLLSQQDARYMYENPFGHFVRPMQRVIATHVLANNKGNFFLNCP